MLLKPSNDVSELYELLSVGATLRGLDKEELGRVDDFPILFLTPKEIDPTKQNFLIAAGFHGNEIAGPWGIANFLVSGSIGANVSFLPLVNPTGFVDNTRLNSSGQSPNTGWIHGRELSDEGRILMRSIYKIFPTAVDGFLTLHEDHTNEQFYLYYFSDSKIVPKKIEDLLLIGKEAFGLVEDGSYQDIPIKSGLVKNFHDGTFEDFLYHRGTPISVCTETPGNGDVLKRMSTVSSIVESFIS